MTGLTLKATKSKHGFSRISAEPEQETYTPPDRYMHRCRYGQGTGIKKKRCRDIVESLRVTYPYTDKGSGARGMSAWQESALELIYPHRTAPIHRNNPPITHHVKITLSQTQTRQPPNAPATRPL